MKFRRSKSFDNDLEGLEKADKKAAKSTIYQITQALQGNAELYSKYRIKKMKGKDGFWEGHIKQNLCFVFSKIEDVNGEIVCEFHAIGHHPIYKKISR